MCSLHGCFADVDWMPGRGNGGALSDGGGRWRRDAHLSQDSAIPMPNLPNGTLGHTTSDMARQLPGNTGPSSLSHSMAEQVGCTTVAVRHYRLC